MARQTIVDRLRNEWNLTDPTVETRSLDEYIADNVSDYSFTPQAADSPYALPALATPVAPAVETSEALVFAAQQYALDMTPASDLTDPFFARMVLDGARHDAETYWLRSRG